MDFRPEETTITSQREFYETFEQKNPLVVMFLMVISLGLYMINWIYMMNKQLAQIDPQAPDYNRGAFVIMIIPLTWYFITFILTKLFFGGTLNTPVQLLFYFIWIIIFMLILKYLSDFANSFSKMAKTPPFIWFLFTSVGFMGLLGLAAGLTLLMPFIGFLLITIPAMQAEMNTYCRRFAIKRRKNVYYST